MRWGLAVVASVALIFAATPSVADVTIKMTASTTSGRVTSTLSTVIYIKGMKARIDIKSKGQGLSILQDVAAKQQLMVNHDTKRVRTYGTDPPEPDMLATMGEPTISVTPSGRTKDLLGYTCTRYTMRSTCPMIFLEEPFTITARGQVWLVQDGRAVAEYLAFTKAASAAGMRTTPLFQGVQPWGMAEIENALSQHGMRLQEETQYKMERSSPLAQGTSRPVTIDATVRITGISSDPIPDDMFVVPVGYSRK